MMADLPPCYIYNTGTSLSVFITVTGVLGIKWRKIKSWMDSTVPSVSKSCTNAQLLGDLQYSAPW